MKLIATLRKTSSREVLPEEIHVEIPDAIIGNRPAVAHRIGNDISLAIAIWCKGYEVAHWWDGDEVQGMAVRGIE